MKGSVNVVIYGKVSQDTITYLYTINIQFVHMMTVSTSTTVVLHSLLSAVHAVLFTLSTHYC